MQQPTKILFIGNFLDKKHGTIGPTQIIANKINSKRFKVKMASSVNNKFLRLLDIIIKSLILDYQLLYIDVYSGAAFKIAETAVRIGRFRKKKIILCLHGGKLVEFSKHQEQKLGRLLNQAHVITSPSYFLKNGLSSFGKSIVNIPNPINLDNFKYNRLTVKKNTLLWVRAFTDIYNPMIPIKIVNELLKTYPDISLTMVGPDKGNLRQIREEIKRLNLESHINIVGPVKNSLLYQYYQTHEIYLNTTSYESFGVALLEAAACGIPIVSNNVGEIPIIWENGNNIQLVESNDINEFCSKIKYLLTNEKLATKQSEQARIHVEKYDEKFIVKTWEELFVQTIRNGR